MQWNRGKFSIYKYNMILIFFLIVYLSASPSMKPPNMLTQVLPRETALRDL